MRRIHEPAGERERRGRDTLDAELVEEHERAADVHERVERAELVKVHVVGRYSVDATLDPGETPERVERASPCPFREIRSLHEAANLAVAAMRVVVGGSDPEVERPDALALDALDADLHAVDAERGGDAAQ